MSRKVVNVRFEIDKPLDLELEQWSRCEGRSKRQQVAILMRKLTGLRQSDPQSLEKLGLLDRALSLA